MRRDFAWMGAGFLGAVLSCSAPCPQGEERCPCYGNGTCNSGLTCASQLCVQTSFSDAGGGGEADAGVDAGVCQTGKTFQSAAVDVCIGNTCCGDFTPCANDTTCAGCLADRSPASCDSNALLTTFRTCASSACAGDFCGAGFGWLPGNYAFFCNLCGSQHCCRPLAQCMGGVIATATMAAREDCLACINEEPSCSSKPTSVQQGATAWLACMGQYCAADCK